MMDAWLGLGVGLVAAIAALGMVIVVYALAEFTAGKWRRGWSGPPRPGPGCTPRMGRRCR